MKNRKAFTLVELLVVIAIIAILAVAGVVGYTVFIDKAHKSNATRDLSDIRTLINAEDTTNEYFAISTDPTNAGITFDGLYFVDNAIAKTGEAAQKVGASGVNTKEIYALAFKYVIANASDSELAALAGQLAYDDDDLIITYAGSEGANATWHLETNLID